MAKQSQATAKRASGPRPPVPGQKKTIGVVSTDKVGTQEIACLLTRQDVGVSRSIHVAAYGSDRAADAAAMVAGLTKLQRDRTSEVIALLSQAPAPDVAEAVLSQVRDSDKPTIVCFLGADQRLIWRSGAIPAARLDETAMRATAWVRGWDQALVTSHLEEQEDQLAAQAGDLVQQVGPARRSLCGFFQGEILRHEAQLMLSTVADPVLPEIQLHMVARGATARGLPSLPDALQEALGDPALAVLLLSLAPDSKTDLDPAGTLAATLRKTGPGPVIIAHVCGAADQPQYQAQQESRLARAGLILATSNAAAALLAGMVVGRLRKGQVRRKR